MTFSCITAIFIGIFFAAAFGLALGIASDNGAKSAIRGDTTPGIQRAPGFFFIDETIHSDMRRISQN